MVTFGLKCAKNAYSLQILPVFDQILWYSEIVWGSEEMRYDNVYKVSYYFGVFRAWVA